MSCFLRSIQSYDRLVMAQDRHTRQYLASRPWRLQGSRKTAMRTGGSTTQARPCTGHEWGPKTVCAPLLQLSLGRIPEMLPVRNSYEIGHFCFCLAGASLARWHPPRGAPSCHAAGSTSVNCMDARMIRMRESIAPRTRTNRDIY